MAIIAAFGPSATKAYASSVYQYDKGQKLIITGAELPERFKICVSNDKEHGVASYYDGNSEGTLIPDEFFMNGQYVYVWVCKVSEGSASEEECTTLYEIVIPVIRRPG